MIKGSDYSTMLFVLNKQTYNIYYRSNILIDQAPSNGHRHNKGVVTTGLEIFAECLKHTVKHIKHSTKGLPSAARQIPDGNSCDGEAGFAECLFSGTQQSFAVCQIALGKIK